MRLHHSRWQSSIPCYYHLLIAKINSVIFSLRDNFTLPASGIGV
ncbi:hypothetical protein yrohd0001_15710 [Yersinia rohdei ATCC 43380]|nr:hypothetical protein yrohd0001_15710 [Yersinia rohdei ATCC 43380]